jgi:uncharacterized protein (UPF0210 family)
MSLSAAEAFEISRMVQMDSLDIRAVTMGISLLDCACDKLKGPNSLIERITSKITRYAERLVDEANNIEDELGIPITNKRIAVTPISLIAGNRHTQEYVEIAHALDGVTKTWDRHRRAWNHIKLSWEDTVDKVSYIGGYSALVHKGWTEVDKVFINSIPEALAQTERVCSSVNLASTRSGINMDAVKRIGEIIKEIAAKTKNAVGCTKFVVFANAVEDNPFMAGAFHGVGEPECVINIGISGPEVVRRVVRESPDVDLITLSERIKRAAFKVVRAGELVGQLVSAQLSPIAEFGIVDLSLAPVPSDDPNRPEIDSLAAIIEEMGIERCGAHGTLAALALLIDAIKRGGVMATSRVGGLSGTFIPVSEDLGMVRAAAEGALTLERLESMTSVCSVGIDMVAIPGDTSATTISAIIADEMAIGVMHNKTTAVRIIPVPGKRAGADDKVDFTGDNKLLGKMEIMAVYPTGREFSSERFINRGSRIPAPIFSLTN